MEPTHPKASGISHVTIINQKASLVRTRERCPAVAI